MSDHVPMRRGFLRSRGAGNNTNPSSLAQSHEMSTPPITTTDSTSGTPPQNVPISLNEQRAVPQSTSGVVR